jgi:hypothetical protein
VCPITSILNQLLHAVKTNYNKHILCKIRGQSLEYSIATDVRELGRKNFNLKVQKSLLTLFEIERDDYVDVPTLIQYVHSKHGK